jgi:hypothetical protein
MIENAAVQEIRKGQQRSMDDGVLDGEGYVGPLPAFLNKPAKMLTPYEQGFAMMYWWKEWTRGEVANA